MSYSVCLRRPNSYTGRCHGQLRNQRKRIWHVLLRQTVTMTWHHLILIIHETPERRESCIRDRLQSPTILHRIIVCAIVEAFPRLSLIVAIWLTYLSSCINAACSENITTSCILPPLILFCENRQHSGHVYHGFDRSFHRGYPNHVNETFSIPLPIHVFPSATHGLEGHTSSHSPADVSVLQHKCHAKDCGFLLSSDLEYKRHRSS